MRALPRRGRSEEDEDSARLSLRLRRRRRLGRRRRLVLLRRRRASVAAAWDALGVEARLRIVEVVIYRGHIFRRPLHRRLVGGLLASISARCRRPRRRRRSRSRFSFVFLPCCVLGSLLVFLLLLLRRRRRLLCCSLMLPLGSLRPLHLLLLLLLPPRDRRLLLHLRPLHRRRRRRLVRRLARVRSRLGVGLFGLLLRGGSDHGLTLHQLLNSVVELSHDLTLCDEEPV